VHRKITKSVCRHHVSRYRETSPLRSFIVCQPNTRARGVVSFIVAWALCLAGLVAVGPPAHADPNTAGTLDAAFSLNTGTGFNGKVESVAAQSDGKVVVGGAFTAVNGTPSSRIARLNADGTVDTGFSTNIGTGPNSQVLSLAVQADGKIVIGGWFTAVNGTPSARIARLNANGSVDTDFSAKIGTGFDFDVHAVALQANGKIVVGGGFSDVNAVISNGIARLNADGTVDTAFSTNIGAGLNDDVESVAVQTDGKIVLGGYFLSLNGVSSQYVARVDANGTPDTAFSSNAGLGPNAPVFSVAAQTDGKVLIGGTFTSVNGTVSTRIARLNANGAVDTGFSSRIGTGLDGAVHALAAQTDGKVLIGGNFANINGLPSNSIARLNTDGTPDAAFSTSTGTGFSAQVRTLAMQPDGKILAGGWFGLFNETTSNQIARLFSGVTPAPTPAPTPTPTPTPAPSPTPTPIKKQSAKKPPAKVKKGKRAKLAKRTRQGAKLKWKSSTKKVCVVKKTTLRTKRKGKCVVRAKAPAVGGIKAFSKKYVIKVK
jgi:uncharacterized delta-60 repeat protein